jgi:ketosteroid isomerase-like protein
MSSTALTTSTATAPPAGVFDPDDAWWRQVFAVIDARDTAGFVALLTPDAQFRFGNAPTVVGSDAIGAAVSGFFAAIASCRHRLIRSWSGSNGVVCEGEVTYIRHDGGAVTVPFANIFELRGTLIAVYRIFIDNSPLFS